MLTRIVSAAAALALAIVPLASHAYGDGTGFKTGKCDLDALGVAPGSSGTTLEVGAGHPYATIQSAVDDASEGDHVVVYPGVYKESVVIKNKPGLRLTGTDRNAVIIDGESTRQVGVQADHSDRTLIENMTGHNFTLHAFHWVSSTGYWGRYLTAYNEGDYGIFAYDSRCGQFDHTYASGAQDGGIYIGECYPCDTVVDRIESAGNGIGYSGTNAGGSLTLRDSYWHDNAIGIVPNSLDSEKSPPQRGLTIEGNTVFHNNGINNPGTGPAAQYWGIGIVIAGGQGNHVFSNDVRDNGLTGIVLSPLAGLDSLLYVPGGNTIWGNTITGNATLSDIPFADAAQGATSGPNNCWSNNTIGTSAPPAIQTLYGCTSDAPEALPYTPGITPAGGDPRVEIGLVEGQVGLNGRVTSPWETWPAPTCDADPNRPARVVNPCTQLPDDNGDSSYVNDGAPDLWLPSLL